MYITKHYSTIPSGKKYRSVLLREPYRENGKVKNRTLANLKNLPDDVIEAIEVAIKHVATKLGITEALGHDFNGKLVCVYIFLYDVTSSYFEGSKRAGRVWIQQG